MGRGGLDTGGEGQAWGAGVMGLWGAISICLFERVLGMCSAGVNP